MCGRFALSRNADELLEEVRNHYAPETQGWDDSNIPPERSHEQDTGASPSASTSNRQRYEYQHGYRIKNYNVAPRTRVPVLRQIEQYEGSLAKPQLESMVWGLIPHYMKTKPEFANQLKTINAREDSINAGSGMWSSIKGKKRCVIFIDGFYEWLKKGNTKLPHFTKRKDGQMMALAGLWDSVHFEDDELPLHTFTIVTCDVNKQLSFLHDRMPVILETPKDIATWMDVSLDGFPPSVSALMKSYEGKLECYQVPGDVGNVKNNNEEFVRPISERKGSIASFFGKSPGKSPAAKSPAKPSAKDTKPSVKNEASSSKRKRSPSPAQPKKRSASPAPMVDPKSIGNEETNAPVPVPEESVTESEEDVPIPASPSKKRKVDKTGDASLAKAAKNEALDSFFPTKD